MLTLYYLSGLTGLERAFRHGTFNPDHNVRTTKDLRQLWLRLSQLHDEKLRAQAQQAQPLYSPNDPAGEITTPPLEPHDLHGPHDTILLDDSAHKARLQPNNHLELPTYGAAELRADAGALASSIDSPHVDEALLAVVGILSEMCTGRVDEWTRSGRVWSGPGAQLDPNEMWAQRRRDVLPDPAHASIGARPSSPARSLTSRLNSLSGRSESTAAPLLPLREPDPPFMPRTRPMIPGETPQWFTCPPLMRAWIAHGKRVLDGLGITSEHECVKMWPGWREGKLEIMGRAKDDQTRGERGGKSKGQGRPKGRGR
jgi:hypothetical protein